MADWLVEEEVTDHRAPSPSSPTKPKETPQPQCQPPHPPPPPPPAACPPPPETPADYDAWFDVLRCHEDPSAALNTEEEEEDPQAAPPHLIIHDDDEVWLAFHRRPEDRSVNSLNVDKGRDDEDKGERQQAPPETPADDDEDPKNEDQKAPPQLVPDDEVWPAFHRLPKDHYIALTTDEEEDEEEDKRRPSRPRLS